MSRHLSIGYHPLQHVPGCNRIYEDVPRCTGRSSRFVPSMQSHQSTIIVAASLAMLFPYGIHLPSFTCLIYVDLPPMFGPVMIWNSEFPMRGIMQYELFDTQLHNLLLLPFCMDTSLAINSTSSCISRHGCRASCNTTSPTRKMDELCMSKKNVSISTLPDICI